MLRLDAGEGGNGIENLRIEDIMLKLNATSKIQLNTKNFLKK